MAAIPAIIMGVGMAGSLTGGIMKAQGDEQKGEVEGSIQDYKAKIADQNAGLAIQQAAENERKARAEGAQSLGAGRAAYGASGVTMEGSPTEVLAQGAAQSELNALTIRHAGQVQAVGYRNEANLARYEGNAARTTGYVAGAADLLAGGATAASYLRSS